MLIILKKLKNPTNYGTNYGGPATKIMQRAALFTTVKYLFFLLNNVNKRGWYI